jgi:peptidoglycan/LPS O-acetylase OafA/YrhL
MSVRPQEGRLQTYRRDAQGLRAVAIIMVVLWHTGILNIHDGVVVSFVLSGYLIGRQLFREIGDTGRVSLGKFWARRMRRLVPGMAIVVVSTIVLSWIFASPLRFRDYVTDGLSSAFSLLNWRLAENGTDYFANNGTQTPYQHFWSLSIEEQFYLVAPLLLVAVAWLSRKLFKNRALVVAALVSIIGASFYLSVVQTQSNQPLAYFGTHTRAWELAVGLLLALGAEKLSRMNLTVAAVMSWLGLALMIGTGMLITDHTALPGYADAGPVLGAAMVLAGGCANPRFGAEWLLQRKPFDVIANVSYGWYLWHWPMLTLWPNIVGHEVTYWDRYRIALFSLFLAGVMHYAIEKRVRAHKAFIQVPRRGIVLGGSLTAATAAFMGLALIVPLNIAPATAAPSQTADVVGLDSVKQAAFQKDLPGNVQPSLLNAQKDWANAGCIDDYSATAFELTDNCIVGDTTAKRTMVVFGDSHARQWADPFDVLGKNLGVKVVVMTKVVCPAEQYSGVVYSDQMGPYAQCDSWRASALDAIESLHPQEIVVTGRARQQIMQAGAEATFSRLSRVKGAKLVYMTDTPYPGTDIPDCLAKHSNMVEDCNRSVAEAVQFPEGRAIERVAAEKYGATVFDVLPAFCTAATCPSVVDGTIVYYDKSHVTRSYAMKLRPWLEPIVRLALS